MGGGSTTSEGCPPTRAQQLALVVATVIGIGLRWWDLGGPVASFDETFTGIYSHLPIDRVASALRSDDAHPPLDYLLRHWFGASGDTMLLRVPSAVFATATLLVTVAWMARRGWYGVVVVTLTSVSSFELLYGHTAWMYVLVILCGTVIVAATEQWVREPRARWRWIVAGALLIGLFDHSSVLVLAGALLLVPGWRSDREAWWWRGGVLGALGVWAAVWGPSFLDQAYVWNPSWIPYTSPRSAMHAVAGLVTMYSEIGIIVLVAVAVGAVLLRDEDRTLARLWALLFLVPFGVAMAIGLGAHFLLPRTLAFAAWAPPLALAAIIERARRASTPIAIGTGVLVALLVLPSVVPAITFEEPSGAARDALADRVEPGDAVAVHPRWMRPLTAWDFAETTTVAVPSELDGLDAYVVMAGDAPPSGRVWVLEPNTYAMDTGSLVPCEDVPARRLSEYTLACFHTGA